MIRARGPAQATVRALGARADAATDAFFRPHGTKGGGACRVPGVVHQSTSIQGGAGEAEATGANPTDRSKAGSKRHTLTEGRGLPIATILSGANRTDMKKLAELLDAKVLEAPPPRPAPDGPGPERHLSLDRGYDYDECREVAAARGYTVHIPPPRGAEGSVVGVADDGAGVQALVVEIGGTTRRPDGSAYHVTWSLGARRS